MWQFDHKQSGKGDHMRETIRQMGLVSQLGLTIAAAILISLGLGHLMDIWTGSKMGWKLASLPLGIASGYWAAYQLVGDMLGKKKGPAKRGHDKRDSDG